MPLLLPLFVHWCLLLPLFLLLSTTRSILVLFLLPLLLLFLSFHLFSLLLLLLFIHLLHLLHSSPPSSSKEGPTLNMSATEAEFWKDFGDEFKKMSGCLFICIAVIVFFFLWFWQSTFYIGLFKPLFVRCNTFLY